MAFSLVGAERWELGHFLVLVTGICESCILSRCVARGLLHDGSATR